MKPLLLLVAFGAVAHAETQVSVRWGDYAETRAASTLIRLLGVDDGTIRDVSLSIADRPAGVHATLRFELATSRRDARVLQLPIELTHGTRVVGMTYSLGGELAIEAFAHDADEARMYFERVVERARDPALLRMVDGTGTRDRLELAVFPVTRGVPATVTIEMVLPAADKVVLDPGPHERQRTLKLPARDAAWLAGFALDHGEERDPAELAYVAMDTSLVAGDEPIHVAPTRHHQRTPALPAAVAPSDRRYELRTLIRAHATQLAHCYEYGTIKDPQLSPSALLAIDVASDGHVTRADVSGELADDEVRWCIADELRGWQLSAADHAREVRQAIDLLHLD